MKKKNKRNLSSQPNNSNALLQQNTTKKRMGKKEKKKIIAYVLLFLIAFFGITHLISIQKEAHLQKQEEARKGKLANVEADKIKYDEEGNVIEDETEIRLISFNDGTVLIKKDNFETLIDPGSSAVQNMKGEISGNIEAIITTKAFSNSIDDIRSKYKVDKVILTGQKKKGAERAKEQIIDMDQNFTIYIKNNGRTGSDSRSYITLFDAKNDANYAILNDVTEETFDILGDEYRCAGLILKGSIGDVSKAKLEDVFPNDIILLSKAEGANLKKLEEGSFTIYPAYKNKKKEFVILNDSIEEVEIGKVGE